jgi:hypothetical protein
MAWLRLNYAARALFVHRPKIGGTDLRQLDKNAGAARF